MSTTAKAIEHFSGMAAEAGARPERGQAAEFFSRAYKTYEQDARDQAALEHATTQGELLELHLTGSAADGGSMQVPKLIQVLDPVSRGLHLAAHRLRYGQEASAGRVHQDVRGAIDLRLPGIAYGSTRLMLVGNSQADTTGVQLFPAALTQLFRVLAADHDDFYDAVHAVGSQAARHFSEFLKAIQREELACEVKWHHDEAPLTWLGSPQNIRHAINMLDTIGEPQTFAQSLAGIVDVLRTRGYFTLEQGSTRHRVTFASKQLPDIQTLTIGMPAVVEVETTKYFDRLSERDIERHRLLAVRNPAH